MSSNSGGNGLLNMQDAAVIFQGTPTTIHSQSLDFQEIIEILRAPDAS